MKETRAERKARKAELREARRHAKEARNVTEVPAAKGAATMYATPAETTGRAVADTPVAAPGAAEGDGSQRASESLPEIHDIIDSWGGGSRREHGDIANRVDKVTRRVKNREVVVQETVTEYVEVPAEEPADVSDVPEHPPAKSVKGKPRLLGFFGPRSTKKKVDAAVEGRAEKADAARAAAYEPQCSALTDDGAQCRNSARHGSKYCASHKGYQPPTAKGIAQRVEGDAWDPSDKRTDASTVRRAGTRPAARKAKDTRLAVRKASRPAKQGGRKKR